MAGTDARASRRQEGSSMTAKKGGIFGARSRARDVFEFPNLPGAACHSPWVDPEWWHPYNPDRVPPEADILCGTCPVRDRCLDWALGHHETGIWGGTTEAQRKALKQREQRQRAKAGPNL